MRLVPTQVRREESLVFFELRGEQCVRVPCDPVGPQLCPSSDPSIRVGVQEPAPKTSIVWCQESLCPVIEKEMNCNLVQCDSLSASRQQALQGHLQSKASKALHGQPISVPICDLEQRSLYSGVIPTLLTHCFIVRLPNDSGSPVEVPTLNKHGLLDVMLWPARSPLRSADMSETCRRHSQSTW